MRSRAVLAGIGLPLLLAACEPSDLPPLGGPTMTVNYQGRSYPMRVIISEPLPGTPDIRGGTVRIVAPDAGTAEAVYRSQCGDRAIGPAARDTMTGEYVVPGPCG